MNMHTTCPMCHSFIYAEKASSCPVCGAVLPPDGVASSKTDTSASCGEYLELGDLIDEVKEQIETADTAERSDAGQPPDMFGPKGHKAGFDLEQALNKEIAVDTFAINPDSVPARRLRASGGQSAPCEPRRGGEGEGRSNGTDDMKNKPVTDSGAAVTAGQAAGAAQKHVHRWMPLGQAMAQAEKTEAAGAVLEQAALSAGATERLPATDENPADGGQQDAVVRHATWGGRLRQLVLLIVLLLMCIAVARFLAPSDDQTGNEDGGIKEGVTLLEAIEDLENRQGSGETPAQDNDSRHENKGIVN